MAARKISEDQTEAIDTLESIEYVYSVRCSLVVLEDYSPGMITGGSSFLISLRTNSSI